MYNMKLCVLIHLLFMSSLNDATNLPQKDWKIIALKADIKNFSTLRDSLQRWKNEPLVKLHQFNNLYIAVVKSENVYKTFLETPNISPFLSSQVDNIELKAFGRHSSEKVRASQTWSDEAECVSEHHDSPDMWYLERINRRNWTSEGSHYAYNYTLHDNGDEVVVYVLDTGVNVNHTDLKGRAWTGYVAEDAWNVDNTADDLCGHGTPIASLIGGTTFGVAKNVTIISVKGFNQYCAAFLNSVVECMEFINQQLNVTQSTKNIINYSFGVRATNDALQAIIEHMNSTHQVTIVAAAGDQRDGSCHYIPGEYKEVIMVGSTTRADDFMESCNWGSCVTILAPGDRIQAAWIGHENDTNIVNGSSYSAALVTGAIARIMSNKDPDAKNSDVWEELLDVSTPEAINIPQGHTTPNHFLYTHCTDYNYNVPVNSTNLETWIIVISVAMSVVFVVGTIAIVALCLKF